MKYDEAVNLLIVGKKVRRSIWDDGVYLFVDKEDKSYFENGMPLIFNVKIRNKDSLLKQFRIYNYYINVTEQSAEDWMEVFNEY